MGEGDLGRLGCAGKEKRGEKGGLGQKEKERKEKKVLFFQAQTSFENYFEFKQNLSFGCYNRSPWMLHNKLNII